MSRPLPAHLHFEHLEVRATPAVATVHASLAAGTLILIGDAGDNHVVLQLGGGGATVTPDAGTSVNGHAAEESIFLMGPVRALRARLGAGNDRLALGGGDLVLPGSARIDLGGGDDSLDLVTAGKINVGLLAVSGGAGADAVTLDAGAGLGTVAGPALIDLGPGGYSIGLMNLAFPGTGGVSVRALGAGIGGSVNLDAVNVAGPVTLGLGSGPADVAVTDSTLGRVTAPWNAADLTVQLSRTQVSENVAVRSLGNASLDLTDVSVGGNVGVGGAVAGLTANGAAIGGDVAVTGTASAAVAVTGPLAARNLWVRSPGGTATVSVSGDFASLALSGNLGVTGLGGTTVNLAGATPGKVDGNVVVTGGQGADRLAIGPQLRVAGDLAVSLGGGDNTVAIGGSDTSLMVDGDLTIKTGDGDDSVALIDVIVTGDSRISTGDGADTLTVDRGARFFGSFQADTGTGDDTVALAQSAGSAGPVGFGGQVTITAGDGIDSLLIGNTAGDLNSRVQFRAPGNLIDGGPALNLFNNETQQVELLTFMTTLSLLGWADVA